MKNIIILFIAFLLTVIPTAIAYEQPDCEIVVFCDKAKINSGEPLRLKAYITGGGNVTFGYLCANGDRYTIFNNMIVSYPDHVFTVSLGDEISFISCPLLPVFQDVESIPLPLDVDIPSTIWRASGEKYIPVQINITTDEEIPSGNHDITVSYFYQDNNSDWHHSSKVFTFYVNPTEEALAIPMFWFGSIIIPIFTSLGSAIVGAYIGFKYGLKKEKDNQSLQRNNEKNK